LIRKRQNHKVSGIRDEHQILEYNRLSRIINRALRKYKNDYVQSICREIEHANNAEPRKIFKTMSTLTRNFKPRHLPVKDENGLALMTKPEIIKRWKQYCEKLMTSNDLVSIKMGKFRTILNEKRNYYSNSKSQVTRHR
jgi:L-rhamnose mutarotase